MIKILSIISSISKIASIQISKLMRLWEVNSAFVKLHQNYQILIVHGS